MFSVTSSQPLQNYGLNPEIKEDQPNHENRAEWLDSLCDSAKYYAASLLSSAKTSLVFAIPTVNLGVLIKSFIYMLDPCLIHKHAISIEKGGNPTSFLINTQEQVEQACQNFRKYGYQVKDDGDYTELINQDFEGFKETLFDTLRIAQSMAKEFDIEPNLILQLVEKNSSIALALGSVFPSINKPAIVFERFMKEVDENFSPSGNMSWDERAFIIAHEFSHLKLGHHYYTLAVLATTTALSFLPGVFLSPSQGLISYMSKSLLLSFGIKTLSDFFHSMLSREFERQADLMAIETLKSNKGAIEFFEYMLELMPNDVRFLDFQHPPNKERLEYCKAQESKV